MFVLLLIFAFSAHFSMYKCDRKHLIYKGLRQFLHFCMPNYKAFLNNIILI